MADPYASFSTPVDAGGDPYAAFSKPAGKPKTVGAAMVQESPRLEPGPRTAAMPEASTGPSWGEVAGNALVNLPRSLWNDVAVPTYDAIVNRPVETLSAIPKVIVGGIENLPQPRGHAQRREELAKTRPQFVNALRESQELAGAVGQDFVDAYGSESAIKHTLSEHPGRVLMDVATVGTAGAALPGRVGQTANVLSKIDPLTVGTNVLKAPLTGFDVAGRHIPGAADVGAHVLGRTTGAGARSIQDAGSAGRELGGPQRIFPKDAETVANADALVTNMNKGGEVQDVVSRAKSALGQGYKERGNRYRQHMAELGQIPETITFDSIDAAVGKANNVGTYKGVSIEPKATATVKEMSDIIDGWRGLDPAEYHTPEGIDALKRTLGNIRDSTKQGSPERTAANRVYDAVFNVIAEKAPKYTEYMADYGQASTKLGEAGRTFSLTEKATNDTAARKLLSATRDNVQTNNKGRANVLDMLSEYDSTLPYAIAGQALQSPMPRGIVANGAATYGAWNVLPGILADPITAIGTMAAFSPRVVGNVVYYGGRAVGSVEDVASAMGITPARLRALEVAGYQGGNTNALADRARELRSSNALAAP